VASFVGYVSHEGGRYEDQGPAEKQAASHRASARTPYQPRHERRDRHDFSYTTYNNSDHWNSAERDAPYLAEQ
jgi:hypothetical protein